MLLEATDVLLHLLGNPISEAFEVSGLLGALVVSFSLAYTTVEKRNVAVELVVEKLPQRWRIAIDGIVSLLSSIMFAVIAGRALGYALEM